ncbi:molybdopterin-dependent oxidoreductase [Actinoplanes flavus]|uniref:Molybdopterin-dependent oxidoreductase n=1 Tax=Actinoplanes flavus TaxID=2820290 RepID=A0ABS3UIS9_9ACTN|nr:molybdopterin-dependent oxidoreductase [Actinoplanes flavus]MBO3738679.1 molybdopterin-dependent oxidoreductase [Actinoplanes flavus]
MMRYWPRRAGGLPPGQRLLSEMPRFSDRPCLPPPVMPVEPRLEIRRDGEPVAVLSARDLEALGPRDHTADFHCVTTWSVTGLTWTGVPLRDVLAAVGVPETPYLVAGGGDRWRAVFVWPDAVAPDVLIATRLNGAALDERHGAPLRLVAPGQYGYKSVKHLVAVDLLTGEPRADPKEHPRARVAFEERHPRLPGRLLRLPYRLVIGPTAYLAERSLRRRATPTGERHGGEDDSGGGRVDR